METIKTMVIFFLSLIVVVLTVKTIAVTKIYTDSLKVYKKTLIEYNIHQDIYKQTLIDYNEDLAKCVVIVQRYQAIIEKTAATTK
tara:strand:+ start:8391 stop:8645 length:255 start_codon:yes stop_codon:yes gene_type:complete